jgi:hypothetical protein
MEGVTSFVNNDKESNLSANYRSPRTQRFAKYSLETREEGVRQEITYLASQGGGDEASHVGR